MDVGKTFGDLCREARLNASASNARLATLAGAAEEMDISTPETIGRWERDETTPNNMNVRRMAPVYRAPELLQNYCAMMCPIGKGRVPQTACSSLEQLSVRLFCNSADVGEDIKTLLLFAADGTVDKSEMEEFQRIVTKLGGLKKAIGALQIFAEKNGL